MGYLGPALPLGTWRAVWGFLGSVCVRPYRTDCFWLNMGVMPTFLVSALKWEKMLKYEESKWVLRSWNLVQWDVFTAEKILWPFPDLLAIVRRGAGHFPVVFANFFSSLFQDRLYESWSLPVGMIHQALQTDCNIKTHSLSKAWRLSMRACGLRKES